MILEETRDVEGSLKQDSVQGPFESLCFVLWHRVRFRTGMASQSSSARPKYINILPRESQGLSQLGLYYGRPVLN